MSWWVFVEKWSKVVGPTGGRPKREHATLEIARAEAKRLHERCRGLVRVHIFTDHETIEPLQLPKAPKVSQTPATPVIEHKRRRKIDPSAQESA